MGSHQRAQAHAKRTHYCTCGKIVRGNGGEWQHREMHRRCGDWVTFWGGLRNPDGHTYITQTEFEARQEKKQS